jgi:hypothetical protein
MRIENLSNGDLRVHLAPSDLPSTLALSDVTSGHWVDFLQGTGYPHLDGYMEAYVGISGPLTFEFLEGLRRFAGLPTPRAWGYTS